jgi:hypothetical protein
LPPASIIVAALYESQGRYAEAEPLYIKGLRILNQLSGQQEFEHPKLQTCLQNFYVFLIQVLQEGCQTELSDHPTTQTFLKQLQSDADAS